MSSQASPRRQILRQIPHPPATEAVSKLPPAEADASHDPAELSRFVVGESPGFSEELSPGHRETWIVSGRDVLCEQLGRSLWLEIRHGVIRPRQRNDNIAVYNVEL
jgi:hypothetical protein